VPLGIVLVVKIAVPFDRFAEPKFVDPPDEVVPAENCTVPDGACALFDFDGATTAVNVTLAPLPIDAFEVVSVVVEGTVLTVTVVD
jgi:hypothetical protein